MQQRCLMIQWCMNTFFHILTDGCLWYSAKAQGWGDDDGAGPDMAVQELPLWWTANSRGSSCRDKACVEWGSAMAVRQLFTALCERVAVSPAHPAKTPGGSSASKGGRSLPLGNLHKKIQEQLNWTLYVWRRWLVLLGPPAWARWQ